MSTDRLAVSVAEAARLASWTETGIWAEIRAGRLKSFKLGKRRLVRVVDLAAYLERRALLSGTGAVAPTARPRRQHKPVGADVIPFPELEPGYRTQHAVSSAAGRGRSAHTKKAPVRAN